MNKEQEDLFNELTPLQKEISLNSISGMNDIESYKKSKGKSKTVKSMEASVSQILRNIKVRSFINSMANHVVNPAIMSRDEMLKDLTVVARVTTPQVEGNGIAVLTELKGGFDVKLKAMKQLAELAGYEAPKQVEVSEKENLTPWGNIAASVDE